MSQIKVEKKNEFHYRRLLKMFGLDDDVPG